MPIIKMQCSTCKYYAPFEGVCCCGESRWCGEFRDKDWYCRRWEEREDGRKDED